jgi:hypothetical protein
MVPVASSGLLILNGAYWEPESGGYSSFVINFLSASGVATGRLQTDPRQR